MDVAQRDGVIGAGLEVRALGLAEGSGAGDQGAPAAAVESPPTGISPSTFATDYKGCLGQLRSKIARGEFAGVGPFGRHFNGQVNPGAHQGTVGVELKW